MKSINTKAWIAIGLALVGGILIGSLFFNNAKIQEDPHAGHEHASSTWTCSMHPQIRSQEPGQCPICGMDLIPVSEGESNDENPMMVEMSETAARLANIQTTVVGTGSAIKTLQLNGKVTPDERLVKTQSSHVSGRIEQLFVNTTGERVRSGQKLATVYSPELISAQQELLQGLAIKETQAALYNAAREKLKALKVSENQINEIEAKGKVQENINIYADRSGIVLKKMVNVGDYLKKGESLFIIADLSNLWVVFDAYENDLTFLEVGDKISFTVASLPGRQFTGKVTFIDPIVNAQSRSANVRVEITNSDGHLKPEMFAKAEIKTSLGSNDQMKVPKSAVMWTGERSIVYVQVADSERKGYELREVMLGPSLGSEYVIKSGLKEGERIVVNGTFTIDAAAQLAGKPSMMNPEGGVAMTGHNHGSLAQGGSNQSTSTEEKTERIKLKVSKETKAQVSNVLQSYFSLKDALVASQNGEADLAARALEKTMKQVKMESMTEQAHNIWMQTLPVLKSSLSKINEQANIDVQRKAFVVLSKAMVEVAEAFGPFDKPIYVLNCPMADDNAGADWLSASDEVMNPYYGAMMLKCGDLKTKIQ